MLDALNWIYLHWDEILLVIAGANMMASAITALTPTPKDDDFLRKVRKVLNQIALNVGHARNAESVGIDPSTPSKPSP